MSSGTTSTISLDETGLQDVGHRGKVQNEKEQFASDLLRGAEEIAFFFYGDRKQRRKVYHLVATSRLPVFKLGSVICARRSVLLKWVQDQEERRSGDISQQARIGR